MKRKHKEVGKSNTGKVQYIGDPQLIPRVKRYLDGNRKKFITSSVIADDLQRQYGDYGRKKKGAFYKSVDKVYQMLCETGGDENGDSTGEEEEDDDDALDSAEREHLRRRKQREDKNIPVDSGSDSDIISADNEEYMEYKDTNAMNSFMSNLYEKKTKHPQIMTSKKSTDIGFYEDRTPSYDSVPVRKGRQMEDRLMSSKKGRAIRTGAQNMPPESDRGELLSNPSTPTRSEQGGLLSDACTPIIEIASDDDATDVSKGVSSTKRTKKHKSASDKKIVKKAKPASRSERDVDIPDLQKSTVTFADVGGNEVTLKEICQLLVHMKHPEVYRVLGVTPPRGILLHGPPGSGKTLLAHAIAGELDLPLLKLAATEIVSGVSGESEERIRQLFEKAVSNCPCIMFIDEIDAITPKRETASKDMERRIVSQLLSCLDDLNIQNNTGVLIIGATNRPDSLDPALRRAGRFDKEVSLGIPDEAARGRILEVLCRPLKLQEAFDFSQLAHLTPGFVGADLMALTREAAITAVNRAFSEVQNQTQMGTDVKNIGEIEDAVPSIGQSLDEANPCTNKSEVEALQEGDKDTKSDLLTVPVNPASSAIDDLKSALSWLRDQPPLTDDQLSHLSITMQDFEEAVKHVQPSAKREGFVTIPDVTWADIGALADVREELQLAILAPVRHRKEFLALGLENPPGVLLAGPPGCGKTLLAKIRNGGVRPPLAKLHPCLACVRIDRSLNSPNIKFQKTVRAVANESGINFISVKGPELLNMYVGESERAVRQVFQRARNSSPCVIFFDELDALCPRRVDAGEGGASVRVVNQLLTEMDGLEDRKQVFIMAASNRPDIIDPAVLRPGRLDKILYVGFPTWNDRVDILRTITKNGTKPQLADDVDMNTIAEKCVDFTGADLAALVREASVCALKEHITELATSSSSSSAETLAQTRDLTVQKANFDLAFLKVRPSVTKKDQEMYEKMKTRWGMIC